MTASLRKGYSQCFDCKVHLMMCRIFFLLRSQLDTLLPLMKEGGGVTIPTIMWLQTSQNVGFLKMCSMKQCPAESTCSGLRIWDRELGGGAEGMAGGTGGMGRWVVCGGAMLQRCPVLLLTSESSSVLLSLLFLKKLSALLLRMVLVLKDKERFSLCS